MDIFCNYTILIILRVIQYLHTLVLIIVNHAIPYLSFIHNEFQSNGLWGCVHHIQDITYRLAGFPCGYKLT